MKFITYFEPAHELGWHRFRSFQWLVL